MGVSLTWVTTRAAGYTSFVLLTASVALGLLLSSQWRSSRWPRFATTELHRFVTLLTLVFIAIHVSVALLDRFIRFSFVEVLVPFISHYRPLWTGLGIVAAYLATAVWLSTWLQRLIGYRWWRRLHFATFVVYAAAAAHGIGSGSDTRSAWSWAIYVASFTLVGGLLGLRLSMLGQEPDEPAAAAVASGAAAGTAGAAARPAWAFPAAEPGFSAQLEGSMRQGPDEAGRIVVRLEGTLWGGFDGSLRLLVQGWVPPGARHLQVTDNRLSLHSSTGASYQGQISVFDARRLRGQISPDRAGSPPLAVTIDILSLWNDTLSGTVRAVPIEASTPAGLTPGV